MRRIICALALLAAGCASIATTEKAVAPNQDHSVAIRDQGYALLYQLLSDEKNLSKLLLIKKEQADVGALLKRISEVSGEAAKQMEAFAKADPHLHLEFDGLPKIEKQTREMIGKTRAKELIAKTGDKFELRVLLTQNEALTYGAHLAVALQSQETDPARQKFLAETSQRLQDLHQALIDLMHTRWKMPR